MNSRTAASEYQLFCLNGCLVLLAGRYFLPAQTMLHPAGTACLYTAAQKCPGACKLSFTLHHLLREFCTRAYAAYLLPHLRDWCSQCRGPLPALPATCTCTAPKDAHLLKQFATLICNLILVRAGHLEERSTLQPGMHPSSRLLVVVAYDLQHKEGDEEHGRKTNV